jgi:hypothetical protein
LIIINADVDYVLVETLPEYEVGLKELAQEGGWRVILYKNHFLLLKKESQGVRFDLKFFRTLGLKI